MTKESKYPVLKIEMKQDVPYVPLSHNLNIYLDDMDMGKCLRNLRLEIGVEKVITAHLEIIVCPDIPKMLLDKIEVEECDMILFERFKESLKEENLND